jgi:ribosomal protein S25
VKPSDKLLARMRTMRERGRISEMTPYDAAYACGMREEAARELMRALEKDGVLVSSRPHKTQAARVWDLAD